MINSCNLCPNLDKQLLQILLELLWVGGDGHGADICQIKNIHKKKSLSVKKIKPSQPVLF